MNDMMNLSKIVLSYPKIKPPSFYCSMENENGLILHYRSRRKARDQRSTARKIINLQGYIAYVMGQLIELARVFYNTELGATVSSRDHFLKGSCHSVCGIISYPR